MAETQKRDHPVFMRETFVATWSSAALGARLIVQQNPPPVEIQSEKQGCSPTSFGSGIRNALGIDGNLGDSLEFAARDFLTQKESEVEPMNELDAFDLVQTGQSDLPTSGPGVIDDQLGQAPQALACTTQHPAKTLRLEKLLPNSSCSDPKDRTRTRFISHESNAMQSVVFSSVEPHPMHVNSDLNSASLPPFPQFDGTPPDLQSPIKASLSCSTDIGPRSEHGLSEAITKKEVTDVACSSDVRELETPSNTATSHGGTGNYESAERIQNLGNLVQVADALHWDHGRLHHRCGSLQTIVTSLYRDRIRPTVEEVQDRLCQCGWDIQESRYALRLCANQPDKYVIMSPEPSRPIQILLRCPPRWFKGWIVEETDCYSDDVWDGLQHFLVKHNVSFEGGVRGAALDLRSRAIPCLQGLALGELRHIIQVALGQRGLLEYVGCLIMYSHRMQ